MPAPPSVYNYSIGKGKLYIATFSGGAPGSYVAIGNCPSVEYEPNLERLPHYSSMANLREKDRNPVIQVEYSVRFSCDEIAAGNLAKFLQGTQSGATIRGLMNTDVEYALKFIAANPIGPRYRWDFWKGTMQPNGPMQLIGEEWMAMDFLFEGISDRVNRPATSPYFDVTRITTTTSTTTTIA